MQKEHSLGVSEWEFTSEYSGWGVSIADFLPGVVLEIARCCSVCSHDSRCAVPIVSGMYFGFVNAPASGKNIWLPECA